MSKFKRVHLTLSYIVPADPAAEDCARETICENVEDWARGSTGELYDSIKVEDAPDMATEADVPDFINEYLEDQDDGVDKPNER